MDSDGLNDITKALAKKLGRLRTKRRLTPTPLQEAQIDHEIEKLRQRFGRALKWAATQAGRDDSTK